MSYRIALINVGFEDLATEERIFNSINARMNRISASTESEIIEKIVDADVVMIQYTKLTKKIINSLKNCKLILRYGIGVENVDLEASASQGIYVANIPDYGTLDVANHAIALLMALSRKIIFYNNLVRSGGWGYDKGIPIHQLDGQTIGIVGFGNIARNVARKAIGLGINVIAFDPYVTAEIMEENGVKKAIILSELASCSDFVTLHIPLTSQTEGIINEAFFNSMKKTAYIINTARGPLIDSEALVTALTNKRISGAAIDVFEKEPIDKNNPLLSFSNVILTPHTAFYSEESLHRLHMLAAEEVVRVLSGKEPRCFVNKKDFNYSAK